MAEKTTDEDSHGWQKEDGSLIKIDGMIEENQRKQSILSENESRKGSAVAGLLLSKTAENSATKRPPLAQNLNPPSEMTTLRVNPTHLKQQKPDNKAGSKLEQRMTKDSMNLKNLTIEKRLKNSETAPDELSPGIPKEKKERMTNEPIVKPQQMGTA